MASVDLWTAAHTDEVFDDTIVNGSVVGDNLILETRGGELIDAGNVRGPAGEGGDSGGFFLEQNFAVASDLWVIEIPTQDVRGLVVETFANDGEQTFGDVSKPDVNTIHISFYHPMTGMARVFD